MSIPLDDACRHKANFHLIPGRLRMGIPPLLKNQALAGLMAHRLAEFPGVRLSYANPLTGQVLINFDPFETDLKLLLLWLSRVCDDAGDADDIASSPGKRTVGSALKVLQPEERPPLSGPEPWHAMEGSRALEILESSRESGLPGHRVRERLRLFGPNELSEERGPSFWQTALKSLDAFMTKMLLVAGGVSLLAGEAADAAVIAAIVVIQALVEAAQSCRAEKSLESLKKLTAPLATVLREGKVARIPSKELVPGDILHLNAGDTIPADALIVEESNLTTNEACLTGESIPVVKENRQGGSVGLPVADQTNMLFSGTSVTGGRAEALVVGTGMQTEMGRIARLLSDVRRKKTNLQTQLDRLGGSITRLVALSVGAVAVIYLLRGRSVWEVLRTGISLAVGAVPEGLPAVLTVALTTGVQRMAGRNALVRDMSAVETLGSVTTICTDKTGTLTKNEMTVKEIFIDGACYRVAGEGYAPQGEIYRPEEGEGAGGASMLAETLKAAALCNNAELRADPGGTWTVLGDPTEGALLAAAAKAGIWWQDLKEEHCRHREVAFDAKRRLMTVVCREGDGGHGVYVKGAPDAVLDCCPRMIGDPEPRILDSKRRREILAAGDAMARKALRVLAVARKKIPSGLDPEEVELESDLLFCGLVGMADYPREGVKEAVQKCHAAGVRVIMITGDHQRTAEAIAAGLGILGRGKGITGTELDRIADSEFAEQAGEITVYSRTTPDQKLRIVRTLKKLGHIVAMTGDGVNDAPAIKEADIGIAMGVTGTDVTREVAGITLSDDNFVTIVEGIEEGRTVSVNLSKSVRYILSGSISQVLTVFVSAALGLPAPMLPAQILWVNLVTESLPAISLTADPPEKSCMSRPPLDPRRGFLPDRGSAIFKKGVLFGLASFALYAAGLTWGGWTLAKARTMAFSQVVINRVFNLISERKAKIAGFSAFGSNRLIMPAASLSAAMLAATIYLPFMRPLFSTVPIGPKDWALLAANALAANRIDQFLNYGDNRHPALEKPAAAGTVKSTSLKGGQNEPGHT